MTESDVLALSTYYPSTAECIWFEGESDDEIFIGAHYEARLYRSLRSIVEDDDGEIRGVQYDTDAEVMTEWRRMLEDA